MGTWPIHQEEFSEPSSLRAQLLDYWFSSWWRSPTWNRPLHPVPANCIPEYTTPCHSSVRLPAMPPPCPLTAGERLIILKTSAQASPSLGGLPEFFFQWSLSALCLHRSINQGLSQHLPQHTRDPLYLVYGPHNPQVKPQSGWCP